MNKMQKLLDDRFTTAPSQKVKALAKQSSDGSLSSFSGLFKTVQLGPIEKAQLEEILNRHILNQTYDIRSDLQMLFSITSEIKAINNQAAILHGERIMRAQKILKGYKEGAFSAWLVAAYGNRQTPYNFLLYYELYESLPQELKEKAENLPRQAMYTLASRAAPLEEKKAIISSYNGETKQEMLEKIRATFPLASQDKRRANAAEHLRTHLEKLISLYQRHETSFDPTEREEIATILKKFLFFVTKT